ncbi:hypothetical protein ATJ97_3830 [Georgenia soli]|uniref:Uncharacterized protein n=1 Tax=Georgenia soli TaxID=638953 RepID=A0A2A9ESQ2_9MICO|nr:hypothetical protein [Georgenia soli]PFG41282.1 hypothetical protein ATJ97_3830 [Georgenia soli]
MSRPTDWSPLQQWEDPVPGDPDEVSAGAEAMARVAATISEAAENLRALGADDGMRSQAVEKFRARALEVAAEIELAQERYANTGTALAGYVEPLRAAQKLSVDALDEARTARAALNAAEADVSDLSYQRQGAADEVALAKVDEKLEGTWARQARAQGDLDAAFAKLREATGKRDDAAETAMGLIDHALKINDLDDSAWRQFLNKNAEFLDGVATVLGYVAALLAVVTLFIPGVNLLAIGLAIGLGAAAINFALAENGNKDWSDFFMDVVGLATLGVGKIGVLALKGARASRAAQVARNRAGVLAPRRPAGTPRRGRAGNRARARRARQGQEAQRAEYLRATTPDRTAVLRDPRSWYDAARENVTDNGWGNLLRSGGGSDAYQMSYYRMVAAQGEGGGRAAREIIAIDNVTGAMTNFEGGLAVVAATPFKDGVATWGGNLLDPYLPDRRLQDDVGGVVK